jgi:hypothetical protein
MRIPRALTGLMGMALVAMPLAAQVGPEARIEAALERARAGGMPVEVLESKVAEGRAKNVPMARIAIAVQNRAQAMERAHTALSRAQQGPPSVQDVAVGTDAIEAGVSEVVLAEIAQTAGPERRTVAIAALAYLVEQGHVPEAALARVREALAKGGDALANLPGMAGGADRPGVGGPPAGVPAGGPPAGVGRPGGPPGNQHGSGRPGGL